MVNLFSRGGTGPQLRATDTATRSVYKREQDFYLAFLLNGRLVKALITRKYSSFSSETEYGVLQHTIKRQLERFFLSSRSKTRAKCVR